MRYWAFLSYSHTDKKWGDWLHTALETYRVPRRLVGKDSRDGKIPERLFPIFRDREELPVSADLGSNINEALKESRYLIVICSPRSAQSRWVGEEIKTFKKLGREDRILALIVDGEPNASDGKPGFKIEDECFHESMRFRMADGELSDLRSEPIAADAREGKDGKTNAKLKLLAGLLGVNYDDLKQREQERRIRRLRAIVTAAAVLLSGFAGLTVYAWQQKRTAQEARARAEAALSETQKTLSQSDFLEALRSIHESKDLDALARLARSLSVDPNNQAALRRLATLLLYRSYAMPILRFQAPKALLSSEVYCAQFSPDGSRIVAGTLATAEVWDARSGNQVRVVNVEEQGYAYVKIAKFSPDSRRIATTGLSQRAGGNLVDIWDVDTGKLLVQTGEDQGEVVSVDFSADGTRVVTASDDTARARGSVRVWDADTGKPLTEPIKLDDNVVSARFSPDSKRILTAAKVSARVWDAQTGKPIGQPMEHERYVVSAAFSPDGKRVVTASYDTARVWDAETGKPLSEPMKHARFVCSAQFSPDGERVVTGSQDKTARVWDAPTGKPLTEPMEHDGTVNSAEFSADGKWIVTASDDKTARVWHAQTGQPISEMKHDQSVLSASFSPDGERILTTMRDGKDVYVWRGGLVAAPTIIEHLGEDLLDQFDVLGNQVVTTSPDSSARVWDMETGKPLTEPMNHDAEINSVQFSPDGKLVVTASKDKTARIWDVATGRRLTDPLKHDDIVKFAHFDPSSKRVVTDSGKTAKVWDVATGKLLVETAPREFEITDAIFSPDGKRLALMGAGSAICDADVGKPIFDAKIGFLVSAQFSKDGKQLLISDGRSAQVIDAQTGKRLGEPIKPHGDVRSARFSPDEKRIVTASGSKESPEFGETQVWDAKTGQAITPAMKHEGPVNSAEFSPDGEFILTGSEGAVRSRLGGGARVWDSSTGLPVSEFLATGDPYAFARFTSDAKRVVFVEPNALLIYDISPLGKPAPKWLLQLAETVAGQHLNNKSIFDRVEDPISAFKQIQEQLAALPANDDWAAFGRWFLADRLKGTISPFSKITVPEYIENRIKENTAESLDKAEGLAIGNPELLQRIKKAREALPETSKE